MKYKELLKKLITYEKNLSGTAFGLQVLVVSLIISILTNMGINKHKETISKENMEYLLANYLDDNVLVIPLEDETSHDFFVLGEVLVAYLKEYNISAIIVDNKLVVEDKTEDLEDLEEYNRVIKKVLSYDEVASKYDLEVAKDWLNTPSIDQKIVLELKK